jgi:hypothetical protein
MSDDGSVGYGKPPRHTQFKKGVSGNPKGRRKGSKGFVTIFRKSVNDAVPVTENGRRHRISKLEAAVKQLVNKAASGDPKATNLVLQLVQAIERSDTTPAQTEVLEEADRQVMQGVLARVRRATNGGSDDDSDAC